MKIAVLSDIHGNIDALNAVMEDLTMRGCEKVFVLGDYAMAGPEPSSAIGYFWTKKFDSAFTMIQGNTDLMIADYSEDVYRLIKPKAPVMAEALRNDVELLSSEERQFLKELPVQLEKEVEGVKFLLVHGSPRKNNEDILPNTPINKIEEMLKHVNADVILCGHTHLPCGFQTTTGKTVINVGSVGRPFTEKPQSCYLIIDVENGKCVFEHHFVEYDKERAAQKMKRRNFKGSDKLAAMLLNPSQRHF